MSRTAKRLFILGLAATCGLTTVRADAVKRLHFWPQYGGDWMVEYWRELTPQPDESVVTNSMKWVQGSLAVLTYGKNISFKNDISCQGVEFGGYSTYVGGNQTAGTLSIGSDGLYFTGAGTYQGWMANGQTLRLAASQTWRTKTGAVGTAYVGQPETQYLKPKGVPTLSAAEDVVWTLSNVKVHVNAIGELAACDVVVGAGATLHVGADAFYAGSCLNARTLTVDGGTVNAYRAWAPEGKRNLAAALKLANGGKLVFTSPAVCDVDYVEIAEGAVTLDAALPLVHDVPLLIDEGATLTLRALPSGGSFSSITGNGTLVVDGALPTFDLSLFTGTLVVRSGIYKLPSMKDWPAGFVVETADSGMVYVMSEEEFDANRIGGTGRYLNCGRERKTLTRTGGGGGYWDDGYWTDGTSSGLKWQDDEIAVLGGLNISLRDELFVYKFCRTGGGFFGNGACVFHLGAGGLEMASGAGLNCWFTSANTFDLTASQQWTTTGSGSSTVTLGSADKTTGGTGKMTAADGILWQIDGRTAVTFDLQGDLAKANVSLTAPASLDIAQKAAFEGYLNCNRLQVYDGARVSAEVGAYLPAGARSVAREIEFYDGGALSLAAGSPFDFDRLTAVGGTLTVAGVSALPAGYATEVTVEADTLLALTVGFANAAARPGALVFGGMGTVRVGCTDVAQAYVFDAASVEENFAGTVEVADGAVLAIEGEVDFPALTFLGDATVLLKLDRGDRIADWSKVTFPPSGKTITFLCTRDDAIRPGEGSLDLGMDFSDVAAADRAKVAVRVDDGLSNSPLKTTATPTFVDGMLGAALSAAMSSPNTQCGRLVWVGRDWGDVTNPANWVDYPNGSAAAAFDPANHPSSLDDVKSKLSNSGIYSSSSWRLDLKGESFRVYDGRANNAGGPLAYGLSNGVWEVNSFMIGQGRLDVEGGATMNVTAYSSSAVYPAYFSFNGRTPDDPFVFEVHDNAVAIIGKPGNYCRTPLGNVRYQVDAGGSLTYRPWMKYLSNGADGKAGAAVFANAGELSFPTGLALTNTSATVAGSLAIRQESGTLHLADEFSLTLGAGCANDVGIDFIGGTAVISNGTTFAGWNLRVAADADFALEIPEGGDFDTAGFAWRSGATLEKKGDGALRLAVGNEVETLAVKLSEGVLVPVDTANAAALDIAFAGGAIGIDATTRPLTVRSGSLTGVCTLKNLAPKGVYPADVAFLTVAAADDPCYTTANVAFLQQNGKPAAALIAKENVTVGEIPCVTYRVTFVKPATVLILR